MIQKPHIKVRKLHHNRYIKYKYVLAKMLCRSEDERLLRNKARAHVKKLNRQLVSRRGPIDL